MMTPKTFHIFVFSLLLLGLLVILGGVYQILGMTGVIKVIVKGAITIAMALIGFFIIGLGGFHTHDKISVPRIASKQVETVYNVLEGILKFLTQLLILIIVLMTGGILWLMINK